MCFEYVNVCFTVKNQVVYRTEIPEMQLLHTVEVDWLLPPLKAPLLH